MYARRPVSLAAFVVSGSIVGLAAVRARGRQTERLSHVPAGDTAFRHRPCSGRCPYGRAGRPELSRVYRPATADFDIGGDLQQLTSGRGSDHLTGDVALVALAEAGRP